MPFRCGPAGEEAKPGLGKAERLSFAIAMRRGNSFGMSRWRPLRKYCTRFSKNQRAVITGGGEGNYL
jgi:hypothetical protein